MQRRRSGSGKTSISASARLGAERGDQVAAVAPPLADGDLVARDRDVEHDGRAHLDDVLASIWASGNCSEAKTWPAGSTEVEAAVVGEQHELAEPGRPMTHATTPLHRVSTSAAASSTSPPLGEVVLDDRRDDLGVDLLASLERRAPPRAPRG